MSKNQIKNDKWCGIGKWPIKEVFIIDDVIESWFTYYFQLCGKRPERSGTCGRGRRDQRFIWQDAIRLQSVAWVAGIQCWDAQQLHRRNP